MNFEPESLSPTEDERISSPQNTFAQLFVLSRNELSELIDLALELKKD